MQRALPSFPLPIRAWPDPLVKRPDRRPALPWRTRAPVAGALIAALALGIAACQPQATAVSIATDEPGPGPATWLAKPDGEGPFPAVALLHGCSGTERNTPHRTVWRGLNRHAALLNENGYVTLIVGSFEPRRIRDGCQTGGKYYSLQQRDAYAAFDHLASLPFVDAGRIGLVGLSLGGGTGIRVAARGYGRVSPGYGAVVAYYPYCDPIYRFDLPLLILVGADDDWTPAFLCQTVARRAPDRVELVVYPDAHHSFDLPMRGALLRRRHERPLPYGTGQPRGAARFAGAHARLLRHASRRGALTPAPPPHPSRQDEPTMTPSAFRAFTFDCYGTLIDWERGMLRALRALPGLAADDEALLAAFARHEHAVQEEHPALLYPAVLGRVARAIAADFGLAVSDGQADAFGASVADWPPFPDSVDALAYLRQQGLLMVLSNIDRASFAASARRLGDPFHAVVTAEDVGSYKPAPAHFERATALLADEGIAPGEVLHVAQSLFHDVVPGRAAGFATCWIDRRAGRPAGPRRRWTWSPTSPSPTSPSSPPGTAPAGEQDAAKPLCQI